MATANDLARATLIPPPIGGSNCHEGVFALLVAAKSVQQSQVDRLNMWLGGYTNLAKRVLAQKTDPRIMSAQDVLRLNAPGFIVGFYNPIGLCHSMVTAGDALIAGRNNIQVGGKLGYERMKLNELKWHLDKSGGHVVGVDNYEVHIATVDQFETRFAQASAEWAKSHPKGK